MVFYNEVKGDDQGPIEVEKGVTSASFGESTVADRFYRVCGSVAFLEGA